MKNVILLLLGVLIFAACGSNSETEGSSATGKNLEASELPVDGLYCYQLTEEVGEQKAVTFISLRIDGEKVSGEQAVEMTGPEYNAVAVGSITGTLDGNVMTVDYDFEIDGDHQVQEQEFKWMPDQLVMSKGPMEGQDGKMVLAERGLFNLAIPKIDCP